MREIRSKSLATPTMMNGTLLPSLCLKRSDRYPLSGSLITSSPIYMAIARLANMAEGPAPDCNSRVEIYRENCRSRRWRQSRRASATSFLVCLVRELKDRVSVPRCPLKSVCDWPNICFEVLVLCSALTRSIISSYRPSLIGSYYYMNSLTNVSFCPDDL